MASDSERVPLNRKGNPLAVRPRRYAIWAKYLSGFAAFVAYNSVLAYFGITPGSFLFALSEFIVVMVMFIVHWQLYDRYIEDLHRRLVDTELLLCLRCSYNLTGLPESHKCPECGQPFERHEVARQWEKWLVKYRHVSVQLLREEFETRRTGLVRKTCIRCGSPLDPSNGGRCKGCDAERHAEKKHDIFRRLFG